MANWQSVIANPSHVYSVDMVPPTTGYGNIQLMDIEYLGNGVLVTSSDKRIFRSVDFGETWTSIENSSIGLWVGEYFYKLMYLSDGCCIAGTKCTKTTGWFNIYKTNDYGVTWRWVGRPVLTNLSQGTRCAGFTRAWTVGPIYTWGTNSGCLFRSMDEGETWGLVYDFNNGSVGIDVLCARPSNIVYANKHTSSYGQWMYSTDYGVTFSWDGYWATYDMPVWVQSKDDYELAWVGTGDTGDSGLIELWMPGHSWHPESVGSIGTVIDGLTCRTVSVEGQIGWGTMIYERAIVANWDPNEHAYRTYNVKTWSDVIGGGVAEVRDLPYCVVATIGGSVWKATEHCEEGYGQDWTLVAIIG